MQLQSLKVTGSVVGRLSAFATAGALVGTFGTGFFLTAHFPTRAILGGVGAVLIATGAILWWQLGRRVQPGVAIALAIADRRRRRAAASVHGPCKVESAYACIRVLDPVTAARTDTRQPSHTRSSFSIDRNSSRGHTPSSSGRPWTLSKSRGTDQRATHRRRRVHAAEIYRRNSPRFHKHGHGDRPGGRRYGTRGFRAP